MISEVVMPQMGADMTEGTLLRWLKAEGESVARGDIIAEIETDKANIEIEAYDAGVFRTALAHEGDVVKVGEVIAVIAGADEDISRYANGAGAGAPSAKPAEPAVTQAPVEVATAADASPTAGAAPTTDIPPAPAPPKDTEGAAPPPEVAAQSQTAAQPGGRTRVSPLARRIAGERGIDLATVRGSGPDGRIIKRDVERAGAPQAAAPQRAAVAAPPAADTVVAPTRMRQAIARRMSQSKREAPHYYLLVDIDMTDAMALRTQYNALAPEDERASINDLIVRACALALQAHPAFNATIEGDAVTQRGAQNVCIAIALDDGLIAPAILDAGAKSVGEIARDARDLAERSKNGALRADEVTEGTFTITNLGAYGIETLIGIIQPPQTAILGVGSVMPQAVVRDDAVTVRQVMKVALSADHRVTDGAQGARFLGEIKRVLETPLALFL